MEKLNVQAFLAVAEMGSFRKAAESLGYTQAGMSYIISAMEEEMGVPLFVREHSGVRLSAEGEALLPQIRQIDIEHRRLDQMLNELKGLDQGVLRIQIFDSVSIHWVPDILEIFMKDYPNVQVELISMEDILHAEEMIYSGEVDCGFLPIDPTMDIESIRLLEEKQMAILPLEHPLADQEKFPIAELGNHPFISMKYDRYTGVTDIFEKHGAVPQTAFCMDNDYAAMAMVNKGHGYCIFPELLLLDIPYDVKCMEFDEPQTRTICIGTRSMDSASNVCKKFIEYTLEWVSKHYPLQQ